MLSLNVILISLVSFALGGLFTFAVIFYSCKTRRRF